MNQAQLTEKIQKVLGERWWRRFHIGALDLYENLDEGFVRVTCFVTMKAQDSEEAFKIQDAVGTGPVDALFQGFVAQLKEQYPSLGGLQFVDFRSDASFTGSRKPSQSDGTSTITVVIQNSRGRKFEFYGSTTSITRSATTAVLEALAFFVNAERAVLQVREWIEDARRRERPETVERHTHLLAELVEVTDFDEAIAFDRRKTVTIA